MKKDILTFEQFEKLSMDKTDYEMFAELALDKNFIRLREIWEDFLIKRAVLFISGANVPDDIQNAKDYYRGGYDVYKKLMRVIDEAHSLKDQKDEN